MSSPQKPLLEKSQLLWQGEVDDAPFDEVIQDLQKILGNRLIAYIGGLSHTRVVHQWADTPSRGAPSQRVQQRLRVAASLAKMLSQFEAEKTIQAWMMGMNQYLDQVSPARKLRDEDDHAAVITAAKAFAIHG
jgi:hypothetical protein